MPSIFEITGNQLPAAIINSSLSNFPFLVITAVTLLLRNCENVFVPRIENRIMNNSFIILNGFHSASLTIFFQNITICGDGIFTLLLFAIIMLSFKKHRELGIVLLIGYLTSGILSQIIKHFRHICFSTLFWPFLKKNSSGFFNDLV